MASINFNFFDNWFNKPPNPLTPVNLFSLVNSFTPKQTNSPAFASITISNIFGKDPKKDDEKPPNPDYYKKMVDQYFWECENDPDYRHAPDVEKILSDDPFFEKKENPTPEEVKENEEWWEEFKSNPMVEFWSHVNRIDDTINEIALEENDEPCNLEDSDLWQSVPHVPGLDGRPLPRKSIKTERERENKFWDFSRQFFLGLWGFRQRPYPDGRPIDVAQAIGYKSLDARYYDFIMRSGGFFYKDRLGRTRGPMELVQLKTAWSRGIIDKDTFLWMEDMDEWAPIHMIYGMEPAIATWEVRFGAARALAFEKMRCGILPWTTVKGQEPKTYKQLQEEAIESRKRDLAVLKANDGVWPGVRTPSHALFLWASGPALTPTLEQDHMPNKYIPRELRDRLAKLFPGLRPWEVLSVEQAMDQITYRKKWYREPLGSYMTGPPYIRQWNRDVMRLIQGLATVSEETVESLMEAIPGFDEVLEMMSDNLSERERAKAEKKRRPN
ncbi:Protein TIC 56, chloroplastic [Linum perenne]